MTQAPESFAHVWARAQAARRNGETELVIDYGDPSLRYIQRLNGWAKGEGPTSLDEPLFLYGLRIVVEGRP